MAKIEGLDFPYTPPDLDFITTAPFNQEVLNKKLDSSRWNLEIPATEKIYGETPNFAFIDWAFDSSQTVMFSQKLSTEEQRQVLKTFDSSFTKLGVNFVYPIHGGYMGNSEITTQLAWGKYRIYDALAPEFQTYETIKELAQGKATSGVNENREKNIELYPNPTSDFISISGFSGEINIFDMMGRELMSINNIYKQSIDLSRLNPGLYLIKLGDKIIKFVKI
jgi:hypothetical protein